MFKSFILFEKFLILFYLIFQREKTCDNFSIIFSDFEVLTNEKSKSNDIFKYGKTMKKILRNSEPYSRT